MLHRRERKSLYNLADLGGEKEQIRRQQISGLIDLNFNVFILNKWNLRMMIFSEF